MKAFLLIIVLITGCASQLTAEELVWQRQMDQENWQLCKLAYRRAGQFMLFDHKHHDQEKPALLKGDLLRHDCQTILGDYWISS